jgi:hypothetical protein
MLLTPTCTGIAADACPLATLAPFTVMVSPEISPVGVSVMLVVLLGRLRV